MLIRCSNISRKILIEFTATMDPGLQYGNKRTMTAKRCFPEFALASVIKMNIQELREVFIEEQSEPQKDSE